jgi:hypothetical protein
LPAIKNLVRRGMRLSAFFRMHYTSPIFSRLTNLPIAMSCYAPEEMVQRIESAQPSAPPKQQLLRAQWEQKHAASPSSSSALAASSTSFFVAGCGGVAAAQPSPSSPLPWHAIIDAEALRARGISLRNAQTNQVIGATRLSTCLATRRSTLCRIRATRPWCESLTLWSF